MIIEVVQGPNGHSVFERDYYAGMQRVCRERGVLLIVDEIQTGLSAAAERCGRAICTTCSRIFCVVGKALGGGYPIGAFITRPELIPEGLESEPWHMLTFMNQPSAAAAALAVLDIVEKENLAERARTLGAQFTERFMDLARRYDVIGDVRGPGLFVGVDFVEDQRTKAPATTACRKAWEFAIDNGLITQFGGFASNVYKFKPPLTTPVEDFREHARHLREGRGLHPAGSGSSGEKHRRCRYRPRSGASVASRDSDHGRAGQSEIREDRPFGNMQAWKRPLCSSIWTPWSRTCGPWHISFRDNRRSSGHTSRIIAFSNSPIAK